MVLTDGASLSYIIGSISKETREDMYKFCIHPNAVTNFDSKASSIVNKVSFRPHQADGPPIREGGIEESGATQPQSSGPDFHVSGVFTQANIIGEVTMGQVDADGNRVSYQWHDESGQFSISDHNYLARLIHEV